MAELIASPVRVEAAGQPPKTIEEFTGRASTGEERASVARMRSPAGWAEPGQRPEFDEYTIVLAGAMRVETEGGTLDVAAGQAVLVRAGEWVRYSTPEGAEYVSVCLPAFSPQTVHRDRGAAGAGAGDPLRADDRGARRRHRPGAPARGARRAVRAGAVTSSPAGAEAG